MVTLGQRIQEHRQNMDLTQEALAKQLNTNRAAVSNWEIGRSEPDAEMITRIADFFKITTDYLLGRTDIKNPDTNQDPEIISISRARQKMTPEQYEKWKQVSRAIFPEAFNDEDS